QATAAAARWRSLRPVAAQLTAGVPLAHYGKLLNFRRHVETEVVRAFASVPTAVREEQQDLRLYGQKCQDCGAVSYPPRPPWLPGPPKDPRRLKISPPRQGLYLRQGPPGAQPRSAHRDGLCGSGRWRPLLRPAHRLRSRRGWLRDASGALLPPHPRGGGVHQLLLEVSPFVK